LRGIAADVSARQPQMLAQKLDQERAGIDVGGDGFAVHRYGYGGHGVLLNSRPNGPFSVPDLRSGTQTSAKLNVFDPFCRLEQEQLEPWAACGSSVRGVFWKGC